MSNESKLNPIQSLLRSRKFWLAIVGVTQTLLFNIIPNFPDPVWQSINVLLMTVIAGITIEDAAQKLGN